MYTLQSEYSFINITLNIYQHIRFTIKLTYLFQEGLNEIIFISIT